jgi:Protein of unknown function (DUF3485)
MNKQKWIAFAVTLMLIAGSGGLLRYLKANQKLGAPGVKIVQGPTANGFQVLLPQQVLDYTSEPMEMSPEEIGALPKDTTFGRRLYLAKDGLATNAILVNVVLMGGDRTSIHKPQFCLPGNGWTIGRTETASVRMSKPHPYDLPVMKLTTSRTEKTRVGQIVPFRGVYLYWFVADNELTEYHWERMWWMARDLIRSGVLQRWAYVTVFSPCRPGEEDETFERMKSFISASVPEFQLAAGRAATVPSRQRAALR